MAFAVTILGVLAILGAAMPGRAPAGLLPELIPHLSHRAERAAAIAAGMLLLMLAGGLRRRKRRAWGVAVALAALEALWHLGPDFDPLEATLSLAILGLLIWTRPAFTGIPDPRSLGRTVRVFAAAALVAVGVGYAVLLLDRRGQSGNPTFGQVTAEVLSGLVGLGGNIQYHSTHRADFVATTLALLGAAALVMTLAAALRPAGGPHRMSHDEAARVRDLLARPGPQDSLGYFALRGDKSVIFSPTGKAAIGYRVIGSVSLAAGDPLGDPEAWTGAIEAWLAETRRYAWIPAVLGSSETGAMAYNRAGLDALELGDEAVVYTDGFSLQGRAMRPVRQAVNRARRAGYSVQIDEVANLDAQEIDEARRAAARWRDGEQERGFAMALGRLADPSDAGCVLTRCRTADGRLIALLHLVPWGDDGLSLDLMRHDPHADNGVVELMITTLLTAPPSPGLARVSLNFAVFRAALERGGRIGAGPVLRLWRTLLLKASRFWQIESLYRANKKYQPHWVPRYLCFARTGDLPAVSIAALRAEAFLNTPTPPWRPSRRSKSPGDARFPSEREDMASVEEGRWSGSTASSTMTQGVTPRDGLGDNNAVLGVQSVDSNCREDARTVAADEPAVAVARAETAGRHWHPADTRREF